MINYILFSMIILIHFTVFKLIGYEVTILNILIFYWLYKTYDINLIFKKKLLIFFSILIIIPLINLEFNLEFIKTYATYIQAIVLIFISLNYNLKHNLNYQQIYKTIVFTQQIILIYSILQIILFQLNGTTILFNPWGTFQFHHIYNPNSYAEARAVGFYLEPSFLALISISLFITRFIFEKKAKSVNILMTFLIIFVAQSMFGFISLSIILMYIYAGKIKNINRYFILFLLLIMAFTIVINLDINRFDEFSNVNSSAYWRIIAPLLFFKNNLIELISGFSFGSIEGNFAQFFIFKFDGWHGTGLDNGIYVYIYYFGILSILFFLYIFFKFLNTNNIYIKVYIIFYILMLNANGAIFSIDIIFLIIIFPIYVLNIFKFIHLKKGSTHVKN